MIAPPREGGRGRQPLRGLELLAALPSKLRMVTRLRLDAALYGPAPSARPVNQVVPRKKGQRLPTLAQVLADPATVGHPGLCPVGIVRAGGPWRLVSGAAVWYHLAANRQCPSVGCGCDPQSQFDPQAFCAPAWAVPLAILTAGRSALAGGGDLRGSPCPPRCGDQRQWPDRAIARTTPVLMGLFSLVTLIAHRLQSLHRVPIRANAWYAKRRPTFSDAR